MQPFPVIVSLLTLVCPVFVCVRVLTGEIAKSQTSKKSTSIDQTSWNFSIVTTCFYFVTFSYIFLVCQVVMKFLFSYWTNLDLELQAFNSIAFKSEISGMLSGSAWVFDPASYKASPALPLHFASFSYIFSTTRYDTCILPKIPKMWILDITAVAMAMSGEDKYSPRWTR